MPSRLHVHPPRRSAHRERRRDLIRWAEQERGRSWRAPFRLTHAPAIALAADLASAIREPKAAGSFRLTSPDRLRLKEQEWKEATQPLSRARERAIGKPSGSGREAQPERVPAWHSDDAKRGGREDVVQETFLKAYRSLDASQTPDSLRGSTRRPTVGPAICSGVGPREERLIR